MREIISAISTGAIFVFAVTSIFGLGLGHSLREVVVPLRRPGTVARVLVANFVFVPVVAVGIAERMSLDRSLAMGLLLVGMAAGAPFVVKLTEHAEHDAALGATALLILLPATVLFMPLFVPLAAPDAAHVSARTIATPLVVTMLLPAAGGFAVRSASRARAAWLGPWLGRLSTVALVLLIGTILLLNARAILDVFGTGAILASLFLTALAFVVGYGLGGPDDESRGVLALATAQRNIAAATLVASQSFHDPRTLVMVTVSSVVTLAVLFPAAKVLRKRKRGEAGEWTPRSRALRRS
jgi:BASS family bile acid:Na+ symporter